MEKQKKPINLEKILTIFSLFWISWAFFSLILTLLGIFYGMVFWILLFGGILLGFFFLFKNFSHIKILRSEIVFIVISIILIVVFSSFTVPTIFSGRDQGAFSSAAILLTENHKTNFSSPISEEFFKIYGEGRALNFPGYNYNKAGELVTQFPLGYTSWLASFYSIFSLKGFIIANGLSLFIFFLSLFFISKKFLNHKFSWLFLGLIFSSFVFSWFLKFTLSENVALFLVWFGIWKFLEFLESEKRVDMLSFMFSFGLLLFVRIEALAFWLVIIILLIKKYKKISKIPQKDIFQKVSLSIAIVFLFNLAIHGQSYWVFIKTALKPFILGSNLVPEESFWSLPYIVKVFGIYSLSPFLIVGILGILFLVSKKQWQKLIPFFIISPTFIYLFSANISPDHPWMLRRFVFSLIPALIFYTVLFLDIFFKRKILAYILISILIVSNLFVTLNYITYSPNENLASEIETISKEFEDDDLVLMDRLATGNPWAMMSGPLYYVFGKQAAYFPNPEDIDKIEKDKFRKIYLIIPNQDLDFYTDFEIFDHLKFVKNYTLKYQDLEANYDQDIPSLPLKIERIVYGKIYLYQ